jgi:hypothetical protein
VRNTFCLEPGENSVNTSEILKTAFGNKCSSRTRKFGGFKKFKEAEIQAITIRDPGGRQQAEMIILRRLCEFVQTGD